MAAAHSWLRTAALLAILFACTPSTAAWQPTTLPEFRISQLTANSTAVLPTAGSPRTTEGNWTVLWEDEFEGTAVDQSKWQFELGDGCQYLSEGVSMCGWGNGEMQFYTGRPRNVRVRNGQLIIDARKEKDGRFTSARLRTYGLMDIMPSDQWKTVRVEAKVMVPRGKGLWAALWMLPTFDRSCLGCGRWGRWAASGEIDVMELRNSMSELAATLHYGGAWPNNTYFLQNASPPDGSKSFARAWHTYAVEWEKEEIRWYVDGLHYSTQRSGGGQPSSGGWWSGAQGAGPNSPFDQPFHLVMNLALGGGYVGPVTREEVADTLRVTRRMLVDYVRVSGWQQNAK